uniref:chaperonin-like RbcX protein 2, chloroplastic n=1 Tax=Erigeron canadensis TaxID=72917 RepID=UPI001CB997AF|nr:chaperonin-like RbcX protein 2, chloroplastic [Erigeron canadensis]
MVGGLCVVGSPIVDSHTSPCLCVDGLTSTIHMNHHTTSNGDLNLQKKLVSKKLCSSFLDSRLPTKAIASKKQKKAKGFVIVNSLGGQYEESFHDVETQIFNLFTYKAVRTLMNQLYEMNPTEYRWFYDFVATNKPTEGKRFLRTLQKEKHELAERVMVTRLHLYGKWVKNLDHAEMYKDLSDQNLELMRERLMETVIWPSDDTNTEKIG